MEQFVGCMNQGMHRSMGCGQIKEGDLPHHQFVWHGQLGIVHKQDGQDVTGQVFIAQCAGPMGFQQCQPPSARG